MGDARVAGFDQVSGRPEGAVRVLDEDARHAYARHVLVQKHHVAVPVEVGGERAVVRTVGQHQETVDVPVPQPFEAGDLPVAGAPGARHQHRIAVPLGLVLGRRGQFGEERIGDLGCHQPERFGRAKAQAAGEEVRPIVQLLHRRVDARGRVERQFDPVVQVARHGRGRDAGLPRDILNRAHFHLRPTRSLAGQAV